MAMIPVAIMSSVPRQNRATRGRLTFLLGVVVVAFLLHVAIGSYLWIAPWEVLAEVLAGPGGGDARIHSIIWDIRLPRALGCLCVGAILGAVGSAFQALFKNPLAEPYIVGVSSGAAVGGAVAVVLGVSALWMGLSGLVFAFVGGMGALGLVMGLARRRGSLSVPTLLLAGVVVGSMLSAILTLVLLVAGEDTNRVLRWLLGSTTPMFWSRALVLAVTLVVGGYLLVRETRRLNLFAMGEDDAQRLGVNTTALKRVVLITATAMTAATVGAVGIIGFVGLVAPHVSRRFLGVDVRHSLAGSFLVGAGILLCADLLAQRLVQGVDLPVGAVTAVIGAPALLVLLRGQS